MKLFILTMLISSSAFATTLSYHCTNTVSQEKLNFTVNNNTNKISFTDTSAVGYAELATKTKINYTTTHNTLSFEYDWYYTAWYKMDFATLVSSHKSGDIINMKLSFDDNDGNWEEFLPFNCLIK